MLRLAAAVFVVRRGASGDQCLLARRRPQSIWQPGYWTFVGEPLTEADHLERGGANFPENHAEGATLRALEHATQRALALHANVWPVSLQPGSPSTALGRARERLVVRERTLEEALREAGLSVSEGHEPQLLGVWRTPPYLARPTDVAVFELEWPGGDLPSVAGPTFAEGAFIEVGEALAQRERGTWPLGALEIEVLRTWQKSRGPSASRASAWQAFSDRWAARHASLDDLYSETTRQHAPSVQTPFIEAFPVRSPTLAPATHTNCYAVGRSRVAIIDPGTPYADEQPRLLEWLAEREARGSQVEQVWITHHHADHTGAANLVRERFGATVMAHAKTAEALAPAIPIDAPLVDEQRLSLGDVALRALFTPGHAAGHLCFFEEQQRHLFSGDNVLGTGTSIVVPHPHGDMAAYMHNLRRIRALDVRLLFPGHGPPTAQAMDRIVDTLRQREARESRLLEIVRESATPLELETLLARLYRGIAPTQRKLASLSLRAHIEKLVLEKRVAWQVLPDGRSALGLL